MKQLVYALLAVATLASCQNELFKNDATKFETEQGVYVPKESSSYQLFVADGANQEVSELKIALAKPQGGQVSAQLRSGGQAALDRYNKANGTNYQLLPESMYELASNVTFESNHTVASIPLKIKDLQFKGDAYALPIEIVGSDSKVIDAQKDALLVLNQIIYTKAWKSGGSQIGTQWPSGKYGAWTFEAMVRRSRYTSNNRSILGSETSGGVRDEIYTRFGDVTITPKQLQIKTGGSQIDIPASKLSAKDNEWYMLSFVYDGTNTLVYVNGQEVAKTQIRDGEYEIHGIWIGGANELVREVRVYKTARTADQIAASTWKMVDPTDPNLLVYYPLNGKKRDFKTGKITEDETGAWDWSKNEYHITNLNGSSFVGDGGKLFRFPLENK